MRCARCTADPNLDNAFRFRRERRELDGFQRRRRDERRCRASKGGWADNHLALHSWRRQRRCRGLGLRYRPRSREKPMEQQQGKGWKGGVATPCDSHDLLLKRQVQCGADVIRELISFGRSL